MKRAIDGSTKFIFRDVAFFFYTIFIYRILKLCLLGRSLVLTFVMALLNRYIHRL